MGLAVIFRPVVTRTPPAGGARPGSTGGRPPGLAPRYQKIAPEVKELYEAGQQSTRQLMDYFQIGSRRTLYKILRFAGCQNNEKSTVPAAKEVDKALP